MVNQRRVPALFSVAMDHVRALSGKIRAAWEMFSHKSTSSSAVQSSGPPQTSLRSGGMVRRAVR